MAFEDVLAIVRSHHVQDIGISDNMEESGLEIAAKKNLILSPMQSKKVGMLNKDISLAPYHSYNAIIIRGEDSEYIWKEIEGRKNFDGISLYGDASKRNIPLFFSGMESGHHPDDIYLEDRIIKDMAVTLINDSSGKGGYFKSLIMSSINVGLEVITDKALSPDLEQRRIIDSIKGDENYPNVLISVMPCDIFAFVLKGEEIIPKLQKMKNSFSPYVLHASGSQEQARKGIAYTFSGLELIV